MNLPGIKNLSMPVETVADIYKGRITMWNDPEIQFFNPNVTLPAEKILVLARQEERDTSTALFTLMLVRMDEEWAKNYGMFRGPDFVNGTCCVSRNWKNVVKFFPADIVGVVGLILSIPYTIGYATRPDIEAYNVSKVSLLENSTVGFPQIDPTIKALQIPMLDYVNNTPYSFVIDNGTICVSRDNMKARGAYPMTAISYVTVSMAYQSKDIGDCCLVQVNY